MQSKLEWILLSRSASCILGDEMGLGKTLQVIAFFAFLKTIRYSYFTRFDGPSTHSLIRQLLGRYIFSYIQLTCLSSYLLHAQLYPGASQDPTSCWLHFPSWIPGPMNFANGVLRWRYWAFESIHVRVWSFVFVSAFVLSNSSNAPAYLERIIFSRFLPGCMFSWACSRTRKIASAGSFE